MTVSLEEVMLGLSEERRQRIERRAAELIAEEINLRELRRLRKLTQTRLSKKLKIGQEGVSRMEKRADMYISTLRGYVEGVGGKLSLVVEFPDSPPVTLACLGLNEESGGSASGAAKGAKAAKAGKSEARTGRKSKAKALESA